MPIFFSYDVIEHFPGHEDPPEPFGTYMSPGAVTRNDIIQLKWLDGRDAYKVRVDLIRNGTLHVMDVKYDTISDDAGGTKKEGATDGKEG